MIPAFEQAMMRAVRAHVPGFGGKIDVRALSSTPWSSIDVAGGQCRLRLAFDGPGAVAAASEILAHLDALETDLPGFVLADLALLTEARRDDNLYARLDLEALLTED